MDKIKSLLTGNTHEDSASAVSDAAQNTHTPHGGLTGEGSHFGSTKDTTTGVPGNETTAGTSNPLSDTTNIPSSKSTSNPSYTPSKGLTGEGSHLASSTPHIPGEWNDDGSTAPTTGTEALSNTNTTTGTQPATTSGTGSHLGRDAAGVGAAGAIGEGIHHRDQTSGASTLPGQSQERQFPLSSTTGSTDNTSTNLGSNTAAIGTAGEGITHSHGTHGQGTAYNNTLQGSNTSTGERLGQDPYNQGTTTSDSHLGRDAALVGGAGAVGEGIHHHNKEQNLASNTTGSSLPVGGGTAYNNTALGSNTSSGQRLGDSTTGSGLGSGTQSSTTGPHSTDTANLLDPRVNTRGATEDAIQHDPKHGGGAENADKSHLGRDAGIGAGALGAAGLAKHEHDKHETTPTTSGVGSSGYGSSTTPSTAQSGAKDTTDSSHHYGRDAGLGAGALGAGALGKHEYDNRDTTGATSGFGSGSSGVGTGTGPAPNTAGPHSKDWMNKLDPRVDAQPSSAYPTQIGSKNTDSHKDDHHLGRDAAVAGGAGGAAYEYEHHKHDKDLTQAERDAKKQHKHDLKEEKKHHHDEKSHLGRDTAVTSGAGGAAYEAEKHHKHDNDLTQAERDAKREHKHELKEEKKHHHDEKSHLGRDTALVGGAGGAAYEAEKHHNNKGTDQTTGVAGDSMWDKLHKPTETTQPQGSVHSGTLAGTGTGYSDTIPSETRDPSSTTGEHHYGRDAGLGAGALGAGGLAEHEYKKHENTGTQPSTTEHPSTTTSSTTGPSSATGEHHYGRDTALGGGALGAGGLAEHEHNKHESTATSGVTQGARQGSVTGTGKSAYDPDFARAELARIQAEKNDGHAGVIPVTAEGNKSTNIAKSDGTTHHYARDGALAGGALGAGGLAEHEYRKHEGAGQPSTTGSSTTGTGAPTSGYEAFGQQAPTAGTEHHYGRDAALGGGALGAGGLAAHEHGKHENVGTSNVAQPSGYSSTTGPSSTGPQTTTDTSKDHHYGRDAAVAGGVGGAAYEADKHHKHDAAEKEAKKEQKHELKEEKKEEKREAKEEKREEKREAKEEKKEHKHGLFSFLHRDKSKKYSQEEEDEFARQEKEHNSHAGRDTALGAGAVGAAGYEAEKHHHADTNKALPTAPGSDDAASTTAIRHGQAGDSALGTSTASHGATPLVAKEPGTDLGDKLHGVDRNRGVAGSSGFPGTEGFGTGIPRSEATTDQYGNPVGHSTDSSHVGRDAALGGLGGAGVGHGAGGINEQKGLESQGLGQHDSSYNSGTSGLPSHSTGAPSGYNDSSSTGRNRLHKEPPAGHPAAQYQSGTDSGSHVPGSGAERDGLLREGEREIDNNTGVAGSHATTGNNY